MNIENIINLYDVEVKEDKCEIHHFNTKISVVDSSDFNTKKLGFDVTVLEKGQLSCPYHYHTEIEELFIILEGEVTLRQMDHKRILYKGDLVFLPNGKDGAHQFYNHSEGPVRYVGIASKTSSDICFYPDSNKINGRNGNIYKLDSKVDYYSGEEDIPSFWGELHSDK